LEVDHERLRSIPGSIRQVISAVNRTYGLDGSGGVIGDRDYTPAGVRPPN
jgi:hypothetical protein